MCIDTKKCNVTTLINDNMASKPNVYTFIILVLLKKSN